MISKTAKEKAKARGVWGGRRAEYEKRKKERIGEERKKWKQKKRETGKQRYLKEAVCLIREL